MRRNVAIFFSALIICTIFTGMAHAQQKCEPGKAIQVSFSGKSFCLPIGAPERELFVDVKVEQEFSLHIIPSENNVRRPEAILKDRDAQRILVGEMHVCKEGSHFIRWKEATPAYASWRDNPGIPLLCPEEDALLRAERLRR